MHFIFDEYFGLHENSYNKYMYSWRNMKVHGLYHNFRTNTDSTRKVSVIVPSIPL